MIIGRTSMSVIVIYEGIPVTTMMIKICIFRIGWELHVKLRRDEVILLDIDVVYFRNVTKAYSFISTDRKGHIADENFFILVSFL